MGVLECIVHRVPMRDPGDVSGILGLIEAGCLAPREIVAILGKTEGNGCVNDFTRGYATMAARATASSRSRSAPRRRRRSCQSRSGAFFRWR